MQTKLKPPKNVLPTFQMITYYGEKKKNQKKGGQHKIKNIWIKDSEKCIHITVTITLHFILEDLENVKNKTQV